tara:strand:+ start:71 stop:589 length:519 start_codon:yes stop_codon:yes gene_type:complete
MIKLKPLSERPLSSQLYDLTGKFFSSRDFEKVGDEVTELSTGTKFILATEQEEEAFKAQEKIRQAEEEEAKKHQHDDKNYPFIDYNNVERWKAGLKHAKTQGYPKTEMCEEAYWHFLECLPPLRMSGGQFVCSEPETHNSQGYAVYLCGAKEGKKYFAKYGTLKQFDSNQIF